MTATDTTLTEPEPVADAASHRPPHRLRHVLLLALTVLLVAEVGVRLVEDRLPPPPDWYTPEYGVKEGQIDRLAGRGGASVVLLGSSVIDVAVDPVGLDGPLTSARPAYNAGLIGANLEMVDVWSEHVVEPALAPDVVVIGVSSRDVNANGAGLESQTPGFYALPAVERLLGTESTLERVERRAGDLSRLVRYRTVLRRPLEALFGYDAPDRNLAQNTDLGLELHLADLEYQGGADVDDFFRREPLRDFALSTRQLDAVRDLVERHQARGTRVVLLDVPVTSQYVALHPRGEADYRDYEVALNVLAAQLGIELVDTGTWTPDAFSDPLHLNGVGTAQLTALLDAYLTDGTVPLPAGATPPEPLDGGIAAPVTP